MPHNPDDVIDPVLLRDGDSRNVVDKYKTWKEDAIVDDLDKSRAPLHIAVENWEKDLNLGTITRSANAFNVSGFHIIGEKKWNRRGAMATYRYVHVYHHESVEDFYIFCKDHDLVLIGIDNCETSTPIENEVLPSNTAMLFGNEGIGLTDEAKKYCEKIYEISMYGSTRSLNSSVAAGIAMYHWKQNN
ncbi:MAG: TrmH family RNA methyltransferase [Acidimicrobiia bacterium]